MVSPYFFLKKKLTTVFSRRPLEPDDLLAISSSPLPPTSPPSNECYKFSHKKIISFGRHPPEWCDPGRSVPPVTPLMPNIFVNDPIQLYSVYCYDTGYWFLSVEVDCIQQTFSCVHV